VGFETTISAGERPNIYSLDRAATGTGTDHLVRVNNSNPWCRSSVCVVSWTNWEYGHVL